MSVPDLKYLSEWTKEEFMPSLPQDSLGREMLFIANWNEFGEGHYLMPSSLAGFDYVETIREVFTENTPHENVKPTENQLKRINILFPRD